MHNATLNSCTSKAITNWWKWFYIECGSTGVAGSDSTSLSLILKKPRPNGYPIGISSFLKLMEGKIKLVALQIHQQK